jgi:hypothetical protein
MAILLVLSLIVASPEILPARECAEIFGSEDEVLENRALRESRLNFVIDSGAHVAVDHSYVWSEPVQIEIRGLELIDTSSKSTALVSFLPSREDIDCDDSLYSLSVDDSLGPDGRVLSVLEHGLLIEIDGRLCYLLAEDRDPIDFRISWTSRFGVPRRTTLSKPSTTRRRKN